MFLPMWQITLMTKFFTLLGATLFATWLCSSSHKRSTFLHPLTLSLTTWFALDDKERQEWCHISSQPRLQETVFLLVFWCFCYHHKDIFCSKKRKRGPVIPGGGWEICGTEILHLKRSCHVQNRAPPGRTHEQAQPRLNEAAKISHRPGNTQSEWAMIINDYGFKTLHFGLVCYTAVTNQYSSKWFPAIEILDMHSL